MKPVSIRREHKIVTYVVEDYLVAIYVLERDSSEVISARVATQVGVTASTMTETLRKLTREGYARVDRHRRIHLTDKGREVAQAILRRHLLMERLLTDVLGLSWVDTHREAHRLEHVISPEVEAKLADLLNHPSTCPHGNPFPGQEESLKHSLPLTMTSEGQEVVIDRIIEEAESDARLLSFLETSGLKPGTHLKVVEVAPWLGTMTLRLEDHDLSVGMQAAKVIRVH
jgi:DtxR family Mn-dependent transcriptional regulator